MKKHVWFLALAAVVLFAAGCRFLKKTENGENGEGGYRQITQDEAKEWMSRDDGHIILDVRRQDEFDAGHIPGAVCIPNEEIGEERPDALGDLDQIILVYCRSGRRSKEAAAKLAAMGYREVYEFGGILDWTGETTAPVTADAPETAEPVTAKLVFDSFDGGGPTYTVRIADESILACEQTVQYYSDEHEVLEGSGYDVFLTFSGKRAGETEVTVSARSPIADNFDQRYRATVDEGLNVTLTFLSEDGPDVVYEEEPEPEG